MFYQITSKSFLFASDSTHEYGMKCQHMRQLAVLQLLFGKPEKIVGTWFEIILSAM
jgi:hypothetical protein